MAKRIKTKIKTRPVKTRTKPAARKPGNKLGLKSRQGGARKAAKARWSKPRLVEVKGR